MRGIQSYWIEEIQAIKEFQLIAQIEDDELTTIDRYIKDLISDQFIEMATENGIARREKMLKLVPFADDTLESRRFKVLSRWNDKLPYTYNVLIQRLDQLCGKGGYTIELNHGEYTLKVKVQLTAKRMEQEVNQMVRKMAPANLLVIVELRYNQHKNLRQYTNRQLQQFRHRAIREEVLNL